MISRTHIFFLTVIFLLFFAVSPQTVRAEDFLVSDGVLTAYYGSGGKIIIPNGVVHIADSVFQDNKNITSVQIPEGCLYIGDGSFDGCSNMTEISLPDTLEEIGRLAFARCTKLERCYLPRNITMLGDGAFRECHALTTLEIPEKTTVIGEGCFCYCDRIENFFVHSDNANFHAQDGALFTADMKKLIQYPCGKNIDRYAVPDGVETICRNAFTHTVSLKEVTLSHTVRELYPFAFSSCTSITEITLPSSVSRISENAFKNASSLCKVTILNNGPDIEPGAFTGDFSVVLYGDSGSEIEAYAKKYNISFSESGETDIVYNPPTKELVFS